MHQHDFRDTLFGFFRNDHSGAQAIFTTYGSMDRATASRVAELLGFDPELVMADLDGRIAEVYNIENLIL